MAELLLAHGAEVNTKSPSGYTPLHAAVITGNTDLVELLIAHGAEVNAQESDGGHTPLYSAAGWMLCARTELVRLLIAHGADVNIKSTSGWTPLHEAARFGYVEIVKLLLAHGADVNARTLEGHTPLQFAQQSGRTSVAELLRHQKGTLASPMERDGEPTKHVCAQPDLGSAQKFICSECGEEIPNAVQYEPPDLTMRCSAIARKCSCGWTCCLRCDPTYNQPETGHECPQCGKFHRGWVRWDPHRNMVDRSGWIQIDGESDHWFKGGLWEMWKKDRESDRWTTIRRAVVKRLKLSDGEKG